MEMELETYENNRVLIVDDQPEIHDDFIEMLSPGRGGASTDALAASFLSEPSTTVLPTFELLHAADGEEACGIIQAAKASGRPIAIAYVDIRMPPGIDGVETTRRIQALDDAVEVVLMTAYTDKSLTEIIHGMSLLHKLLYVRKPLSREEIQQITLSLVGKWNVEQAFAEQQRRLAASYQRLEAVLDATGDAMAMHDTAERLIFANKGFEALCGLTEHELKALAPDALAARLNERFQKPALPHLEDGAFSAQNGDLVQEIATSQQPRPRLFYRSAAPVRDSQQDVIGRLWVYRDMSREIEVEQMKDEVLRLRTELETTHSFASIVGDSPRMRQMFALMRKAIDSDTTVLVLGESGTGKELVAKAFHYNGPRLQGPFLAVNCSAIPEMLIESELFGHERGAFTGATRRKIGFFERAQGGTLLLDEIGDMPLALQVKLLRVLQEQEIQRVGGSDAIRVDARIVASTNRDLEAAVKDGTFREDLFYRLAVFPIAVPPLRERREDIPLLVNHLLNKHAERLGKVISGVSPAALRAMLHYDWPGNVRELENAVERAVLMETTEVLKLKHLPSDLLPPAASRSERAKPAAMTPLAEMERQAIARALDLSGHNINQAARHLGINRATLYRKLKKYDLSTDS